VPPGRDDAEVAMPDPDGPRTEWLHAAADVLRALDADESPATLLRRVARHTCALTGADSCAVMLLRASRIKDVQRATIRELEKTNAELTRVVASLHRERAQREWAEAQDRRLVRLLLEDVGLDGVLGALGEALAARVVLESVDDGSVLAEAGEGPPLTIAGAAVPDEGSAVRVGLPGVQAWVLTLSIAREPVARLWVARDADTDTGTDVRPVIERFAPLVALELHKRGHAADTALRLTRDLAVDLVTGAGRDVDLRDRARALGRDLTRPHTVVLLDTVTAETRRALGDGVLVGEDSGAVVALVPDADRSALVAALICRKVRVVVGPTVTDTGEYPAAWRIARTAAALTDAKVVDLEELGVASLLLETGTPDGLRRLADRRLGPLEDHDAQRSTELVATLRAWFDAGGSTSAAARELHVHPHTVGYRLRRVAELTGLDPQRADDVFELRAALVVRAVQQAATTS